MNFAGTIHEVKIRCCLVSGCIYWGLGGVYIEVRVNKGLTLPDSGRTSPKQSSSVIGAFLSPSDR